MLVLFGVIGFAGLTVLYTMARGGIQFASSTVFALIPLVVACLGILAAVVLISRFVRYLFGEGGVAPKYQERREEEAETIRRQREALEKMARRIESLETILMDEAPPKSSGGGWKE